MEKVTPYKNSKSKKEQIAIMFDNISENYDFLNHALSLGMDNVWRKKAIKKLRNNPKTILDIATGTGDFAVTAAEHTQAQITGIDISQGMLDVGMKKITQKKLTKRITLQKADSEKLLFKDNSFDAITAGFGVRNFENLEKGLSEIYRVLNSDGMLVVLEPSTPASFPLKQLYSLYFHHVLPIIGSWISKDKNAYKYLPDSVDAFPAGPRFITKLEDAGFKEINHFLLTFGVVSLYVAIK
jgi:demethylmenaquinone methyltransferase/2-methoxy-6-polyprenyl-1,4-benzoquinol methylase